MEDDDPWDWLIDRVVQEFCTDKRSWELRAASSRLPDPVFLEKVIRENEIAGDVLLIDLDDKTMREDLQISKLGWRSFIRYGVDQLRLRSPKYKDWLSKERSLAGTAPVLEQFSNSLPSVSSHAGFNFTINSTFPIHMPSGDSGIQNSPGLQPLKLLTEREAEGPNSSLNEAAEDVSGISGGNKRRKLETEVSVKSPDRPLENNRSEPLFPMPSLSLNHSSIQQDNTSIEQIRPEILNHTSNEVQSTKKRKRIAPTLITTAIDQTRDRTIPTEADTVRIYLHSQLDHGYLGNSKMSVNEVFYGNIAAGEQIPSSEMVLEFQERSAISNGRRLYIHRLMKHFLCVDPERFERNHKALMAVKPYQLRLAPKGSFTLYRSGSDDAVEVTRQALSSWPEINPEAQPVGSSNPGKSTFSFDENAEGNLLANAYEDPDALNKYNMLKEDDEELPLYGESGSENGFDTETWEAIDEEAKERAAYIEKEKQKNKFLTPQEVEVAVDAGIADLVSQWQDTKLPKRRQKAFRLWTKSRRTGSKHADILKAQQNLKHLVDSRIPKLRENIILGQWSNEPQVRHQTRIMEVTIFDREDLVYTIALLQKKSAPPKLATTIPVKAKNALPSGNDSDSGESIHSESSAVESVNDINDFVVEELNLADDEDDTTMSDDSLPYASVNPSQGIAKLSSKSASSVQHGYDNEGDVDMASLSDSGSPEPINHSSFLVKTESTVPPSTSTPKKKTTTVIDLVTPESNRVSKLMSNFNPSSLVSPINLSSGSDQEQYSQRTFLDLNNLPSLTTPAAVSRHDYKTWEGFRDRNRLIVTAVDRLPISVQKSLFELIATMGNESELQTRIKESIDLDNEPKGLDEQLSMALLTLVRLFWIYIDCKFHLADDGWMRVAADVIRNDDFRSLKYFYNLCKSLQSYFQPKILLNFSKAEFPSESTMVSDEEEDGEPQGSVRRRRKPVSSSDSERFSEMEQDSPSKKQSKFFEDADARDLREQDRARVIAQEERKKQLRARLRESDDVGDVRLDRHIINEGKFDDQGYIYVDEEIGKRIKSHQLDGVRFIWNQITADGKATQGCLLAHTMGLGKTMQTITILVALAQAASSADDSVSSQVPDSLRMSRTIILCPPGLIANWVDELLTWSPDDILGDLRPIESAASPARRLRTIGDWFREGGILLIGYDMFRRFITGPQPKPGQSIAPLNDKLELARTQLLEGPNVVVADEAHKMKNYKSALTSAASKFRTKTRIALTGSPLANNVEEYHTMVEWIAPNYLGPIAEFRAKYKEPIEQGLYLDSTRSEKTRSRKMLEVLKEDLSPKVHRADTSVLRDDLPPKKEFIISVSLTELQKQAYITYVRSMASAKPARTKSGQLKQTTVWSYINILTLLCNHPSCFKAKLDERSDEVHRSSQNDLHITNKSHIRRDKLMEARDVTDEDLENDPEAWKVGVSEDLISAEVKVFESVSGSITNPELSNKVKILCQILDASRAVGDKVLVFSQTLTTLDFLEVMCKDQGRKFARLDGKTVMSKRQTLVKDFNSNDLELYLISTNAGGLGLNLYGANRVVIFDFRYNPINEEQAIGRAYRIGQKKHVFVYRLMAAGTFESSIQNKAVFKTQLASRVVDKKNPLSWAQKGLGEILFEPREIRQEDLSVFEGMDSAVLDNVLSVEENKGTILKIIQSDDFEKDDDDRLTPKDKEEVRQMVKDEQLKRSDPQAFHAAMRQRGQVEIVAPRPQVQQRHQSLSQSQMLSLVKNEMVNSNKSGNSEIKIGTSDVEEISPGSYALKIFLGKLRICGRTMNQFPDEATVLQRTNHVYEIIRSVLEVRFKKNMNDERRRMAYQRASAFIGENNVAAQQLLSLELSAEEFINRVASWWKPNRPESTPVNGQQLPDLTPLVNDQKLRPAVSLAKNGHNQATNNGARVEFVVHPQSNSSTAQSNKSINSSNTIKLGDVIPGKDQNISSHSKPTTEDREQNVLSQDSTGDIPLNVKSLSEVIQHPYAPPALITDESDDESGKEQVVDSRPIEEVAFNDSVEATTSSNAKLDKSHGSLPTTSSSNEETKMFHAINRQPQSLRIPVVSPSKKKKKKKHRGNMHAEDSEELRRIQQQRLARGQALHPSSPLQPARHFDTSTQAASAQPTSFSRPRS
ncbi:hypothetical protein SBOR_5749 [Sclerotinia borealis F-4128]|uniref:SNF2 family helicase/ATPase n=1 Tax=Sclerotinia borealis (strain F-4128) TaxID=1432307 RepID=W9CAT8_SCLBF|nr:hypothetical protein SBOR_5749 [Sclerotinia borealis F-4128]